MLKTRFVAHRFFTFSVACFLLFTFASQLKEGLNEDVFKYTNQFRRSRGLPAVIMRDDLNAIARRHSEDMARGRRSFGHSGFNQRESEIQKIIKPFYGMAENVAFGARSGKDAVSQWKNSSVHRRNMLGNYKFIGIGTAQDRHGVIYYTQIFVR
jgi:uncharacterized protein YkwD